MTDISGYRDLQESNTSGTENRSTIARGRELRKNRFLRQRRGLSRMINISGTFLVVTKCLANSIRKDEFEGTIHHSRGRRKK